MELVFPKFFTFNMIHVWKRYLHNAQLKIFYSPFKFLPTSEHHASLKTMKT